MLLGQNKLKLNKLEDAIRIAKEYRNSNTPLQSNTKDKVFVISNAVCNMQSNVCNNIAITDLAIKDAIVYAKDYIKHTDYNKMYKHNINHKYYEIDILNEVTRLFEIVNVQYETIDTIIKILIDNGLIKCIATKRIDLQSENPINLKHIIPEQDSERVFDIIYNLKDIVQILILLMLELMLPTQNIDYEKIDKSKFNIIEIIKIIEKIQKNIEENLINMITTNEDKNDYTSLIYIIVEINDDDINILFEYIDEIINNL